MGDWFTAADLLIHPSYSEGLGSVILEAIKAGVAVVASKAGGIPDIVEDGVNGLLVEAGNPTALANSVARIASDDELREQLVRNATEKLKPFEIEHTAKLYEKLYTRLRVGVLTGKSGSDYLNPICAMLQTSHRRSIT